VGVKAGAKAQLAAVDDTAIKHEMDSFMVVSFGRSEPGWLVLVWFAVAGSLTYLQLMRGTLVYLYCVAVFIYQDTSLLFIHKGTIKNDYNEDDKKEDSTMASAEKVS
jgi:hypothetical protein